MELFKIVGNKIDCHINPSYIVEVEGRNECTVIHVVRGNGVAEYTDVRMVKDVITALKNY
jgi:hypothetical protein